MKTAAKFALMLVMGIVTSATGWSLTITPLTTPRYEGTENKNLSADDLEDELGLSIDLIELYKATPGQSDELSFGPSYNTVFSGGNSAATVTYVSPLAAISGYGGLLLYVKDGKNNPAFYVFNISGWNGTETINLSGFWPDQGAISHITILGSTSPVPILTSTVPDGGMTALMLGVGLFGVGMVARTRFLRA